VRHGSSSPILAQNAEHAVTTSPRLSGFGGRRTALPAELKARIRWYNGGLDPDGETFGAALILVAGCEYGQNVDLLARRTGLSRAFVARCARRLIDNGVWVGGRTVSDWAPDDPASGTFWSDVAVAEGKMCRRTRPDGSFEWAPAGHWNKNFHFLDPDADDRLGNLYLDSVPADGAGPDPDDLNEDDAEEADAGDDPGSLPDTGLSHEPVEPPADITANLPEPATGPEPDSANDSVPPLHHIFRDAVWIG
jgi:hypothetical protein